MIVGISVGDIIFSFHHGLDHVLSATNIYHWPVNGPLCTWLGIGTTAGFFYQSGWILCMSVSLLYEFQQDMLVKPKVIPMKYFFFVHYRNRYPSVVDRCKWRVDGTCQ